MEQEGNILKLQAFWILNNELQEWEIQMKTITTLVADKCNITLNFPALDFPHSNGRNMEIPT